MSTGCLLGVLIGLCGVAVGVFTGVVVCCAAAMVNYDGEDT
jgi:hypothetical protein